jgi:two-component system CheB/CheR fusion protein
MTEPETDEPGDLAPVLDPGLGRLLDKLSKEYEVDFREYKTASLERRIRARMAHVRVADYDAYARFMDQHPGEHVELFDTILINVTGFFRDPEAWGVLRADVIPRIVAEAEHSRSIRVWSAGCSSGEEVYSAAVLIAEQLGDRAQEFSVKIYGTDIDQAAVATARHGLYRVDQLKELPSPLLERYFEREGQMFRFRRDLRRWCIFGIHNLTQAAPLSHIDLLICRNVLIYFGAELQERVLTRFHYSIREGGYLFLGRSESLLTRSRLFSPLNMKWRIFQRSFSTTRPPSSSELPAATSAGNAPAGADPHTAALRLQRVLDSLPTAVFVIDVADRVLAWNPTAEALFEIPGDAAVGKKFRDLDVSYRLEGLRARIEDAKLKHSPARIEDTSFTRRTGEMLHASVTIVPLFEGAHLTGVVVTATDATELSRLREQMMRVAEQHATAIEELQSTNEELETTNEELQSTNEELETTVEELQAANTELVTLNSELEDRTAAMRVLDEYHMSVQNSLQDGLVVLDASGSVKSWNRAAEGIGREFSTLPIGEVTRLSARALARVTATGSDVVEAGIPYARSGGTAGRAVLRVSPLRGAAGVEGLLLTFTPDADPGGA